MCSIFQPIPSKILLTNIKKKRVMKIPAAHIPTASIHSIRLVSECERGATKLFIDRPKCISTEKRVRQEGRAGKSRELRNLFRTTDPILMGTSDSEMKSLIKILGLALHAPTISTKRNRCALDWPTCKFMSSEADRVATLPALRTEPKNPH